MLYGEYDRKTKEDAFEILQAIAFRTVIKPCDGEWGVDKNYEVDVYDISRRAGILVGSDVCKLLGGGHKCDVLAFSGTVYFSDTDYDGTLSTEEISKAIGEEADDLLKKKLAEYASWKVHVELVSLYLALKGVGASIASATAVGGSSAVSAFAIPVPIIVFDLDAPYGHMSISEAYLSGNINVDGNILNAVCPVNLTVVDQYGLVVSNNGTNQIPNASVIIIGDAKTFYLPADLIYSVSVDAYDAGTFNFTSITPVNDGILITGFMNVSITENTTATLEVEPNEAIHTMKIDYDGDGKLDEEKSPDVSETITTLRGDLNSDGILDAADAAIALEIAVGSRQFDDAADVSRDGRGTSLDALMILQTAGGAINI
ncbi:MAG: hypothetical protein DIAAKJNI_00519 [Candidatus Argoarchaeum ethanivorans]|uniref:Dockerin domain-containing protein n=1 Tax=Candidatus Argoarchaeum ethanivorans TaxID=2608793 RepID=A0A811TD56_9EURY|nr:MAG: hypothetical protein DIAAKJNI_00519 [Candidatus Argoarchaeum ethanivorans]